MKDDILQLNFHTFIGSWTQFKELHGPFINLGVHLPQNIIFPIIKIYHQSCHMTFKVLFIYTLFEESNWKIFQRLEEELEGKQIRKERQILYRK